MNCKLDCTTIKTSYHVAFSNLAAQLYFPYVQTRTFGFDFHINSSIRFWQGLLIRCQTLYHAT